MSLGRLLASSHADLISEIILTLGHSRTVETFLKQAHRDRKFTVIVAESAPTYLGHAMASSLSSAGIPTLLVPDSSIHALMPRVTKLVLGAHTVLANGGLFALSGTLAGCLAAKAYSKPVVVATGQFKFAPAWNTYHEFAAVDFQGPGRVLDANAPSEGEGAGGVEVVGGYYDYIRPELVNLFVTNESVPLSDVGGLVLMKSEAIIRQATSTASSRRPMMTRMLSYSSRLFQADRTMQCYMHVGHY